MRSRVRLFVLVTLLALTVAPAAAHAAGTTTIDFESTSAGTKITNQYAAAGVVFDTSSALNMPEPRSWNCGTPGSYAQFDGGNNEPALNGRSARIDCLGSPAEIVGAFNAAFEFTDERRSVSFNLKSMIGGTKSAIVAVYAAGGGLLESQQVSLPQGAIVPVSFDRGTPEIVGVRIDGNETAPPGNGVYLDDISAPIEDPGNQAPPKFTLALGSPSVDVFEGGSVTVPVIVRRYGGSVGPVQVNVGALPSGITATQVTPNPVSGLDPANLKITAAAPLSGDRQVTLTVQAAPGAPPSLGTAVGTARIQTVHAIPALVLFGGRPPVGLVPGCTGPIGDFISVRGGYFGNIVVKTDVLNGPVTASPPSNVFALGDGLLPFSYSLTPTAEGTGAVRVTLTPASATPVSLDLNTRTQAFRLDQLTPSQVPDTVTSLTLRGIVPLGCPVSFRDDLGQDYPVLERDYEASTQTDIVTLGVPSTGPVSAPFGLRLITTDGREIARTPPLLVTNYRNVNGLRQANSGFGAGSDFYFWDDFVRTFGEDEAYTCVGFCVKDPTAVDYHEQWLALVKAKNGLCFGYSDMSLRFAGAKGVNQPAFGYEPGAVRAWELLNFADGSALKRDIVRWHVAQFDEDYYDRKMALYGGLGPAVRTRAIETIKSQGGALVSIRNKATNSGHAVVAYRVEDLPLAPPAGTFRLWIYDPNLPYHPLEENTAARRTAARTQSYIDIAPDGSWKGSSLGWSGGRDTISVVDTIPANDSTLPSHSLWSLLDIIDTTKAAAAATGSHTVSSIRSSGRELLDSAGEPKGGSGITSDPIATGGGSVPNYLLARGKSYDFTVVGGHPGPYRVSELGDGSGASITGADTKAGQKDHLTFTTGKAQLGYRPGGESKGVTLHLTDKVTKNITRTATVITTVRRGGSDNLKLSGGGLTVNHSGKASTLTVKLASVGAGTPTSATTTVRVGANQRVELKPRSWSNLANGVGITVRDAKGRVLRRGRATLRSTRAVAFGSLRAAAKGKTVTVSGRISKRGKAPVLAATVELLRGGKVVTRRTASLRDTKVKKGRFSLKVTISKLSKGTRVRVTTTLLDEAAGYAGVRRTTSTRAR